MIYLNFDLFKIKENKLIKYKLENFFQIQYKWQFLIIIYLSKNK